MTTSQPRIRLVRAAPDPIGLYIRAGRNDQSTLMSFIDSGDAALSGVVFEAKRVAKQRDEKLFESGARAKATFGCHDTSCCTRGIAGMLQAPGRHFAREGRS